MNKGLAVVLVLLALAGSACGRRSRPSLLLVTVDTLRADHVGAYGYARAATPVLDGLARRGARFERVESAAPLTGPSHATILTGLYPPQHGVRENVSFLLDARHPTLATRLEARGYRTAAFVGAYPVAAGFGFGRGFQVYDEGFHPNPGIGQGAERPANEVADAATAWLSSVGRDPFFAWVHFYDPHAPYTPPERHRGAASPYDGEVAFADEQLGRLLEAVHRAGRQSDTLVVVVADHGEGLGEHDEATHGILLHEATLRVPLIAAGPGVPSGRVIADVVGTVDLVPTVLGLLGLPTPEGLPGRDLRAALAGRRLPPAPLYSEALFGRLNCRWSSLRGWTEGEWKLIEGAETELFDLTADPGESRNRAGEEAERARRLRDALRRAVGAMAPGGDRARAAPVSAEQAERLRSLGYAAGGGGAGRIDEPGLPDPRRLVALFERLQVLQSAAGPAVEPAIGEVAGILDRDPGSPFAHFVMAALAWRSGRLGLAQKAFERTLALDPDRPVIRQYYGTLLRDLGRPQESERELRIAVEQAAPHDSLTRISLAETLVLVGKDSEAEALLTAILNREPNHAKAHGAMGRLLLARGEAQEALAHLVAAAGGAEPEPFIDLARAYLAVGDSHRAREAAGRALAQSPGHPWALGVAGHALVLEGRQAEGLQLLRRAFALRPRRAEAWKTLAAGFAAAGDVRSADRCRRHAS